MGDRELEGYRSQFRLIRERTAELTAGLTEARFNWRPAPASWSIEECLAHLVMVGQCEVGFIEDAIRKGQARGLSGTGPYDYGAIDRYIVSMTEPPVRDPLPTPRRFVPLHGQPLTAILPTFEHIQSQFLRLIDQAEGLDLARVKVATPISRWLKMSLGMMFAQVAAHERRHLEQARRVLCRMSF